MKHFDVFELAGKYCIAPGDGQRLYEQIHPILKAGEPVTLDFSETQVFASPFFNFAIGQLLRDLTPQTLNDLLKVKQLAPPGKDVLRRVIENAKLYYASSPEEQRAADEAVDRVEDLD